MRTRSAQQCCIGSRERSVSLITLSTPIIIGTVPLADHPPDDPLLLLFDHPSNDPLPTYEQATHTRMLTMSAMCYVIYRTAGIHYVNHSTGLRLTRLPCVHPVIYVQLNSSVINMARHVHTLDAIAV